MPQRIPRRHVLGGVTGAVLTGVVGGVSIATSRGSGRQETIHVISSSEKAALMTELARKYNATDPVVGDIRPRIEVQSVTSGATKNDLVNGMNPPVAWLPTSSMWLRMLEFENRGLRVSSEFPITKSTLVIAMPQSVAEQLRKDGTPLDTWKDVLELAPKGLAGSEQPRFLLGRDNAETSTSGLAATVATYNAATAGELNRESLNAVHVQHFVRDIELSTTKPGNEATEYMQTIYDAEQQSRGDSNYRPYLDAVVIQEQMAYAYNLGAPDGDPNKLNQKFPHNPLRVVHPDDGTLELDHPFVIMSTVPREYQDIAEDFYQFLLEPEQQQRFAELGFRSLKDATWPTPQLEQTLKVPHEPQPTLKWKPDGALLHAMVDGWKNARRKTRILLLLDLSGSMNERAEDPNTNPDKTKLQRMIPAAQAALNLLHVDDEVGLRTFATNPTNEVMPIMPVGEVRETLKAEINELKADGGTALYQAIEDADLMMQRTAKPDHTNAIVLLSDGRDTGQYPGGSDALLPKLNQQYREIKVPIYTIAYGTAENDIATLRRISTQTLAAYYDATNPAVIDKVFDDVFRNIG